MKLITLLICLIVLSLTGFGNSQESYFDNSKGHFQGHYVLYKLNTIPTVPTKLCRNKLDSVQQNKLDLDSIGAALIKGIEYRELYYNEQLLTKVLKYQIDLWKEKDSQKEITIQKLITELSKQPTFISSHDWKITILITGLTAILTAIITLQLTK